MFPSGVTFSKRKLFRKPVPFSVAIAAKTTTRRNQAANIRADIPLTRLSNDQLAPRNREISNVCSAFLSQNPSVEKKCNIQSQFLRKQSLVWINFFVGCRGSEIVHARGTRWCRRRWSKENRAGGVVVRGAKDRGGKGDATGMMKSSFILYIVCMKISDLESPRYCARGLDTLLARSSRAGSLHSLWIRIATGRRNRDISMVRGLHRVKLTPRGKSFGGKRVSPTNFSRQDESSRESKTHVHLVYSSPQE